MFSVCEISDPDAVGPSTPIRIRVIGRWPSKLFSSCSRKLSLVPSFCTVKNKKEGPHPLPPPPQWSAWLKSERMTYELRREGSDRGRCSSGSRSSTSRTTSMSRIVSLWPQPSFFYSYQQIYFFFPFVRLLELVTLRGRGYCLNSTTSGTVTTIYRSQTHLLRLLRLV